MAKTSNISLQTAHYRLKNLIQNGLIKYFLTVMDFSKIGYMAHKIYMKIDHINSKQYKKIIDSLIQNERIFWLASMDHNYNLTFTLLANSLVDLDQHLNQIRKDLSNHAFTYKIISVLHGEYIPRNYFSTHRKHISHQPISFGALSTKVSIDEKDFIILNHLAKNSRITTVDISKDVKLTPENIAIRIKKLEQNKIIKNYILSLNVNTIDMIHYKLFLQIIYSKSKKNQLIEYIKNLDNVIFVNQTLGEWDFEIDFEVQDIKSFNQILTKLLDKHKELIQSYWFTNIEIHKYNFFPFKSKEKFFQ